MKLKLRWNLAKCTFGVKYKKWLGFIVNQNGIKVDPDKVQAILEISNYNLLVFSNYIRVTKLNLVDSGFKDYENLYIIFLFSI